MENYIGKKLTELTTEINAYPIIDEKGEILSFISLDGYILLQGDLPAKIQHYNIEEDFDFDKNKDCYKFKSK